MKGTWHRCWYHSSWRQIGSDMNHKDGEHKLKRQRDYCKYITSFTCCKVTNCSFLKNGRNQTVEMFEPSSRTWIRNISQSISQSSVNNLGGASLWSPPSWWRRLSGPRSPPLRSHAAWRSPGQPRPRPSTVQRRGAARLAVRSPPVFPETPEKFEDFVTLFRNKKRKYDTGSAEAKGDATNHDVLLVSLLLDVFVCSLDVLNMHRTQFA